MATVLSMSKLAAGAALLVLVAVLAGPAAARPRPYPRPYPYALSPRRFVAVPLDTVGLIREVREAAAPPARHSRRHQRVPEDQAAYGEPQPQASAYGADNERVVAYDHDSFAPEPDQARNRFERQSGGGGGGDDHEYVDYGAHTGHHGAFGWYADFPVISKGHR